MPIVSTLLLAAAIVILIRLYVLGDRIRTRLRQDSMPVQTRTPRSIP